MSFTESMFRLSQYAIILLSVLVMVRCIRSMLSIRYEPEIWGYIKTGKNRYPLHHWEVVIGRSRSADIELDRKGVRSVHAVLRRRDNGRWWVYDVFRRGGVWVNDLEADSNGLEIHDGDVIDVASVRLHFQDLTPEQHTKNECKRLPAGRRVSPFLTLLELSLLQVVLLLQFRSFTQDAEVLLTVTLGFAILMALQWACYTAMRVINRSGFEIETIAFYLTTLGLSVTASSAPALIYKQVLLILCGVLLFVLFGWWLRNLRRTAALKGLFGLLALALLGVNIAAGSNIGGATNWLTLGGFSFQPSEFVKVLYVYTWSASLDRLYRGRNLVSFAVFSAVCVLALAYMGDFGTALVFFVCFLVMSFLRSGSISTVILAVTAAATAAGVAISSRPYIASRFSSWGHVWEDVYNTGYQQTRAMSAAASGGLFGKGAGNGWLTNIIAADTDMVFAVVCEELGLLVGILMILGVLTLAFFAVRSARQCRSSYYSIAACSAMTILLAQVALNVFGTMDLLPFTGVTFPFVSRGGSSLLSCWMMMAFIKGADNRRGASFAVGPMRRRREPAPAPAEEGESK